MAANYNNMAQGSGPPPQSAAAAQQLLHQHMRQNYINQNVVPPGHPSFPGNNGPNQMAQVNARYQQQFQRFGPQLRPNILPNMKVVSYKKKDNLLK